MVHVAHAVHALERNALLHQVFVNVEQAAARKDLVEFVFAQLILTSAARHDHGLDVEIVERVRDAVKQHAVVGGDLLALLRIAGRSLRIAAAQIARRQHRDRPDVEQHRLRGEADLTEQTLGAAPREIEHRVGVLGHFLCIANHRDHRAILDVEQLRAKSSSATRRASAC